MYSPYMDAFENVIRNGMCKQIVTLSNFVIILISTILTHLLKWDYPMLKFKYL